MNRAVSVAVRMLPLLLTLLAQVLLTLPVLGPGLGTPLPVVAVISVCYWSLYRPEGLDPLSIFVLGIVCDALAGLPLGTVPIVLLLLRLVIPGLNRRYAGRRPQVYDWLVIPLVVAFGTVLVYGIGCYMLRVPPSLAEVAFQAVAAVALYPVMHVVFNHVLHLQQRAQAQAVS